MRGLALLPAIILAGLTTAPAVGDISLEYAVKAAYLSKFIPFITWPEASFASPNAPVTICVLGDDPFGGKLEQAAAAARAGDRPIQVRHLTAPDAACHVVFLSSASDPALAQASLEAVKGKPVLTVTDSGLTPPGIISFVVKANHVRFDIDEARAEEDGLSISSKLLSLANSVRQRGLP